MNEYLKNFVTSDLSKATHLHNKTYIQIPKNEYLNFMFKYCDEIINNKNICLFECTHSKDFFPLNFEIFLTFDRSQVSYKKEAVFELIDSIELYITDVIIKEIQLILDRCFKLSEDKAEFFACYLRRDDDQYLVWNQTNVIFTAKIIFPYAKIYKKFIDKLYKLILTRIQINSSDMNDYLPIMPMNGFDTMIKIPDPNFIEMYGSTRDSSIKPYKLRTTYGSMSNVRQEFNIKDVFSFILYNDSNLLNTNLTEEKNKIYGIEYFLPMFLSINYYPNPLDEHDNLILSEQDLPRVTLTQIKNDGDNLDKIERLKKLLTLINISRIEEYWSWLDIGQAIKSEYKSTEGLNLWKWFTEQGKRDPMECDKTWITLKDENITIATLEYFAYKDNKENYKSFKNIEIDEVMLEALEQQEHKQVAEAFKACFQFNFVCSNYSGNEWYEYKNHRWVPTDGNYILMRYLSEKFYNKLELMRAELASKVANTKDKEVKNKGETRLRLIAQLMQKLSTNTFKKSICEELKIYYFKQNFNQIKDGNYKLTATPSGVIDVRGDKAVVRPGKPEDYITKITTYDYPFDFTWETDAVKEMSNYLYQLFRSEDVVNYVVNILSSLLLGGNPYKLFLQLIGTGNNSKTQFINIVEAALGNYVVRLPISMIASGGKIEINSPTPHLIYASRSRVGIFQEPSQDVVLDSGKIKEISSAGDKAFARDLHQKGKDIIAVDIPFLPILVSNHILSIPDCQKAIHDRMRVIRFTSIWDDNAPDDLDEQMKKGHFKADRFFNNKIPLLSQALLWIMVQKYQDLIKNKLKEPNEVLEATRAFSQKNNYYLMFTHEMIKDVYNEKNERDKNAYISLDETFMAFRKWFSDQKYRFSCPTKQEFKENLEYIWNEKITNNKYWFGRQLLTQSSTLADLLNK
ncbi:MAG: PriCT-2 domain-containing protein [Candidatus Micrarchaeaceae archaeon]